MVVTEKLWLLVLDEDGEPLLTVKSNGTVEHGKNFTPEKVSAVFDKMYTYGQGIATTVDAGINDGLTVTMLHVRS